MVRADGRQLVRKLVNPQTATNHWLVVDIDLSTFVGKGVNVECRLLGGHLALLS